MRQLGNRLRAVQLLCCFSLASVASSAELDRSVSTSRQFVVYGGDVRLRGIVCDLAEETKRALLNTIGERDNWTIPIVINARLPEANFPEAPHALLQMSQTAAGLKLQLDLQISAGIQARDAQRELLRAIMLEMMYRERPVAPGTAYVEPPAWLVEGILARGEDRAAQARLLAPFANQNSVMSLADFLQQRPELLEPSMRALHRAYAAALLDSLLNSADGRARLASLIRDISNANDAITMLTTHFPAFAASEGADKTWREAIARFCAANQQILLGVAETQEMLPQLLHVQIAAHGATKSYSLEELARDPHSREARAAARAVSQQLLVFEGRANPVYREIVIEYQEIATLLAAGHTHGVAERLARVKQWCDQLATRMGRIDDYLNWFEATQSSTPSGVFADYLNAAAAENETRSRRADAISIYLDALESQISD